MPRKIQAAGYQVVRLTPGRSPMPANVNVPEGRTPPAAWLAECQLSEKGFPLPNLANAMLALRSEAALCNLVAFDEMAQEEYLMGPTPDVIDEADRAAFRPRPLADHDVSVIQEHIQLAGLGRLSKDTTHQAVDLHARQHRFHPVRDYLDGLVWDGTPRLRTWLTNYFGAEVSVYASAIGEMFLVAMVNRVFRPGCKMDYMLVLEGEQGKAKSSAIEVLGGRWFSDGLPDITMGKDVSQHLKGKWLIEIAEMSAMSRAENNALKSFLTRRVERYRPSYGRKQVSEPRQGTLIGSTNPRVGGYLTDETGARRYWPVKTGEIDLVGLKRDRDQLFAEAVTLYREDFQYWPNRAFEAEFIKPQQEARYETDAWEDPIAKWLAGQPNATLTEVAVQALGIEIGRVDKRTQGRIRAVLHRLGWAFGSNSGGRRMYVPQASAP